MAENSQHTIITNYLNELQRILATGDAREHAYRPAFQKLIENIATDVMVVNEPAYKDGNAPDFLFKKGDTPIAYAECKDITVDISKKSVQDQADRYVTAFGRILLTNYYDFEIISEQNEDAIKVSIAICDGEKIVPITENFDVFVNLIIDYLTPSHRTIRSAKKLARIMASKARILHDNALASFDENETSDIVAQYNAFKEVLINELAQEEFADMYAQTLVYGLFVARYHDASLDSFSRHEAQDLLPSSNPLLKNFFGHVGGVNYDKKIAWLVDSLVEAYASADVADIMHKEFTKKQRDPVLHFYETFLAEYDQILRKSRGVYYTPVPVVSFIVRSIDAILKEKFDLTKGLADTTMIEHTEKIQASDGRTKDGVKNVKKKIHKVQILDPAVGTGTFFNEAIYEIHKNFNGQEGIWNSYVHEHLLPRLHGFELMMASYTMAHLKIGVTLKELGYENDERLSIWLTNSLEEGVHEVPNLFMSQWLTEESNSASKIKSDMPIMVVMGNPPYSGESANADYSEHNVYKVEPGGKEKLQEKNSKWINDDYVKFIRLAEKKIEKTGEGVVGMITPHGYLDNPTFRGMRWHLMQTFDEIYVVDLHGNARKKEISSDGSRDENVFDIMTGVAILLAVKKKGQKTKASARVFHTDFYGTREFKYGKLDQESWSSIKWHEIVSQKPYMYFVPFNYDTKQKYDEGFSVAEMFPVNSVGVVTSRDAFVLDDNKEVLKDRIKEFLGISPEEARQKYSLRENKKWKIVNAQEHKFHEDNITKISYRPFDEKWIYYHDDFIERSRENVMKNFLNDNVGLVYKLGNAEENSVSAMISKNIIDFRSWSRPGMQGGDYIGPLYIYHENNEKTPNFDKEIWQKINFVVGDTTPEDVLDYIYAVLHSPSYREKYKEFLKIDFPRVSYPEDNDVFWKLVEQGRSLRELHLLESSDVEHFITTFPEGGTNVVEKKYPLYENGNVHINESQYFGCVSELAWNFYIGGYQPAQKWLKDRRGRELSTDDIIHYQKMIVALTRTDEIMQKIDTIIIF